MSFKMGLNALFFRSRVKHDKERNMINPERLRAYRTGRNLTRDALAEKSQISSRQIARIEAATESVAARTTTIERLAQALNVDPDVLSGDADLPPNFAARAPTEAPIHPGRLREIRRLKRWSRKRLSEKSGVSERQIARIESAESAIAVRSTTANRLAKALQTDATKLKEPPDTSHPIPGDVQIGAKVSPKTRLAYDLIESRYGPSPEQLVVLAPLLFVLLAEGSLARRRTKLNQVCETLEHLKSLAKGDSSIAAVICSSWEIEEGASLEQESIEQADLLGEVSHEDIVGIPFADYLRDLAADIDPGVVSFGDDSVSDDFWVVEPYQVCREELEEITDGSQRAKAALEFGDVRVSDLPRDLPTGGHLRRIGEAVRPDLKKWRGLWLEDKLSDESIKQMEGHGKTIEPSRTRDPQIQRTLEGIDQRHKKIAAILEGFQMDPLL